MHTMFTKNMFAYRTNKKKQNEVLSSLKGEYHETKCHLRLNAILKMWAYAVFQFINNFKGSLKLLIQT